MYYFIFKTSFEIGILYCIVFLESCVAFNWVHLIRQNFILTLVLANDLVHAVFYIEK